MIFSCYHILVFEHNVRKGCEPIHPNDFKRYGVKDDPERQFSYNEALGYMDEIWGIMLGDKKFLCPAKSISGINAGTNKKVLAGLCLSQHLETFERYNSEELNMSVPPQWLVDLDALGYVWNWAEGHQEFLSSKGLGNEYTKSQDPRHWNSEWLEYQKASAYTGREITRIPPIPNAPNLINTDDLRATLRSTVGYFLRTVQGIPFKLGSRVIDPSFIKNYHQAPWTIDFRAENDAKCLGGGRYSLSGETCRHSTKGDIRVSEIDDIERRTDRGLDEPPPSAMPRQMFMAKRKAGHFQPLCLDCHRGKSRSEQAKDGDFIPLYLQDNTHENPIYRKIRRLISDYKLSWKCCPACGDEFNPLQPNLIDLHHPGELYGVYDAEGKCLVLGKSHNVSQMHLLPATVCLALLPHELVKTVPICCGCHRVITAYASKRWLDYYKSNGLHCENPQEFNVPFGIGVVRIATSLVGPETN